MLTKEQIQQARQEMGLNKIPTSTGLSQYEQRKKRLEENTTERSITTSKEQKPADTNYLSILGDVFKGAVSSFGSTVARVTTGAGLPQGVQQTKPLGQFVGFLGDIKQLYDIYKQGKDSTTTGTIDKIFPGQGKINTLGGMTIDTKYSKKPKEAALQMAEDVINVLPGGIGTKALGTIKNPLIRGGATLGVRALEGGTIASSASGIGALKEGDTFGGAFEKAKEAFAPGMILGASASLAGTGISKLGTVREQKLFEKAKNNYAKATDVNASQVLKFKEKTGKPLSEFLIEEQLPLETMKGVQGTKINTQKAVQIIKEERIPSLAQKKVPILETRPQADFYFDDLSRKAKAEFDKPIYRSRYTAEERNAMKAKVDSALKAEAEDLGTNAIDALTADRMKTTFASRPYSMADPLKSPSNKAISDVLRNEIELKFKGNPGENIIKDVNKKMSQYYSALDALGIKKSGGLHGKVVRGGLLGSKINQIIGATVGSKVPVVGPLLGAKLGEKFTDYVRNPARLTQEALDIMKQRGEVPAYLSTLEDAKKYLYQQMLKPSEQLSLPAAGESMSQTSIPLRGTTEFEKPAKKIGNQNSKITKGDNEFFGVQNRLDEQNFLKNEIKNVKQNIGYDFIGQQENDYQKFVEIVKNPKYLNPRIKESIQTGDVQTFKNLLRDEVGDIFGKHEGLSDDKLFDMFRERLVKENPNILGTKKLIPNFGSDDLFGAVGGLEYKEDEKGNKKLTFNPDKAIMGIGLMAGINKIKPSLMEKVSKNLLKEDKDILMNFVTANIDKKLTPELEIEARRFLSGAGINPDISNKKIANIFYEILARDEKINKAAKDATKINAIKNTDLTKLKEQYHNCLDVSQKVQEQTGKEVTKGIYVKGAKNKDEAERLALDIYGLSKTERLGGATHAWNQEGNKVFDYHLQNGEVKDPWAYVPEERIKELKTNTPKEIDPLVQEAKKYKSADEFIKKIKGSATQYGDYTPHLRQYGMSDYKNISELGVDPNETVTIYRGIDKTIKKVKKQINDGDFVTTDFDSALAYTGDPKDVVSMEVPAKTLYTDAIRDFTDEPFYIGSEYVYTRNKISPLSESQLTDIWNKANKK